MVIQNGVFRAFQKQHGYKVEDVTCEFFREWLKVEPLGANCQAWTFKHCDVSCLKNQV